MTRTNRFRPTRAGIINLWDYSDQEFSFADGRLVLRGPNGSGKTKALEVLFPFVFDGRIEPRRLNPFAGEERTMKSNLLYRGQESAYSYVWMEFSRGDRRDPEAVTVGIGMRASRTNDKVTRWYFVADGRVGVDFSLLGPDDRPLTKKQLVEQIGSDAVVDRPIDYRAAVDARLFGLGAERYDQLINLILTLRRPQLAKNLDPKGLSQALTDGLRPLDEHLVLDAARSFSDMEEVGRALDGLVAADRASTRFVSVYSKYLAVQARTDVDQVAKRLTSVEHATTALFAAKALRERRSAEQVAAEERYAAAERAHDQATADRDTLQRSSAYEGKQQLDDLADVVRKLEVSTEAQRDKAGMAQSVLGHRVDEADKAAAAHRDSAQILVRAEEDLQNAAEDAGIAWTPLPSDVRSDRLTAAVRGHAEERDGDLRAVRSAVAVVERAATERARSETLAARAHDQATEASAALAAAETAVELARGEVAERLRAWWSERSTVFASLSIDGLYDALDAALALVGDDDARTLSGVVTDAVADALDDVRRRAHDYDAAARVASEHLRELTAERDSVAAERDDAPPVHRNRTSTRADLPGAPLWRLVRFADTVTDSDAAAIEAALQGADLLDSWILPSGVDSPAATSDSFLQPADVGARPQGPTLADLLVVENEPAVDADRVLAVLQSISLDTTSSDSGIGTDGTYRLGVQHGRHHKPAAEFIGATARAARRVLRLSELDTALAETAEVRDTAIADADTARRTIADVSTATAALPVVKPIVTAVRRVSEAAGALRGASAATSGADRDLDQAIAEATVAEKALRVASVSHRAPHVGRQLDALAAAIKHFENMGATLLRRRAEFDRESERERESGHRLAEARDLAEELAEEAAISETGVEMQVKKLDILRESLGAGADRIVAELDAARKRIEACKSEQKAAHKADNTAREETGTANGTYRTAVESLRYALTETIADAERLAPYAHRDLLSLLGADVECTWPGSDAAWSSVDQVLYRIESEALPDAPADVAVVVVDVLPALVTALFRTLSGATESVKVSDATRKVTRTALTGALQEFDAQLAASGQDFRLHWDVADGVTVVRVQDEQGYQSITDFAHRIELARTDQETLLTDSERRILEDALLTGLAQQIHERTVDARELIAHMASEMKDRRMSSGNTIGVRWVPADSLNDGARAVSKLLDRDASALGPDELATMRAHFASEIRIARAAHPERSYPEILSDTLDYRRWRVFSFLLISADGSEDRLTVARHSALSGGEQSVSLHLPLFAAAHVMLSSADPHSPRLLALDEAFAGVDDNGRSELLGLSVQFDLDLFMTGYDLWITYAGVPGCAHYDLAHSAASNTVSAALLVWEDGELLAEHDGSDLAAALGSPLRRRVPTPTVGGLDFADA